MFIFTAVEKGPQKKKVKKELEENSNEDELNDLKITRIQNYWKKSIEDKINDESEVIEQKNLRFLNSEKYRWG